MAGFDFDPVGDDYQHACRGCKWAKPCSGPYVPDADPHVCTVPPPPLPPFLFSVARHELSEARRGTGSPAATFPMRPGKHLADYYARPCPVKVIE